MRVSINENLDIALHPESRLDKLAVEWFSGSGIALSVAGTNGNRHISLQATPKAPKPSSCPGPKTRPSITLPEAHYCHKCVHLPKREASTYCGKVKKYRKMDKKRNCAFKSTN